MANTILIDASPLSGGITGAGRYAYELLDVLVSMDSEFEFQLIVPDEKDRSWDINHWDRYERVTFVKMNETSVGPKRQLSYALSSFDYDLFHSLSSLAPLFMRGKMVTTIHDLKHFNGGTFLKGFSNTKNKYIKTVMKQSMKRSDQILAVSEHTKSDIQDIANIPSESITVSPLGPGNEVLKVDEKPPIDSPYLFFIGSIRPHKNLDALLEAFEMLSRTYSHDDLQLVIAGGDYNGHTQELQSGLSSQQQEKVHFIGKISDRELAVWYTHTRVFVYPSLYEGFGLPPLEAMGYGVPVAVSNRTSIPEVVGDAGVYFDPTDSENMADTIDEILSSQSWRAELSKKSKYRYQQFTWETTAEKTLEAYDAVLN
ncbi:glycosyltransferase family 4 protein [Halobacterium noricense]|uniref:glycosyltransferase family 4 protein n=1 Tax=Halobacterium noricense TaxID=223182 RepID=UPI001E55107E|nr:glycosyltransferase family 1 protein [Halobacterium noricense]UHH26574.1 glycosyltransferase family 4 protein [Halobacterium noricense]